MSDHEVPMHSSSDDGNEVTDFFENPFVDEETTVGRGKSKRVLSFVLKLWTIVLFLTAVVILVGTTIVSIFFFPVVVEIVHTLVNAINSLGVFGAVLWVAAFTLASAFPIVPPFVLQLIAGFVWGFWIAAPVAIFASPLGCLAGYIVGRLLGRGAVLWLVEVSGKADSFFNAVVNAGVPMMLLLRASPGFPHVLLNYILGAVHMPLLSFVWTSCVGPVPEVIMLVALGAASNSLIEAIHHGPLGSGLPGVIFTAVVVVYSVILTVGALVLTIWLARKRGRRAENAIVAAESVDL